QKVCGDIFEVDDDMLKRLDKLENHPHIYERTQIDVQILCPNSTGHITKEDPRTTISCFTYLFRKFKPELLTLPFMDRYAGDIIIKYVPPQKRTKNPFIEVMPDSP
ncbi:hypothetical protein LSAT2_009145, partial [Lamellibrachia satsuma]